MPDRSGSEQVEREIRGRVEASAFHSWMGITVVEVRGGEVDLRLEAREDHGNLQGSVHGGVLATLADTAAGLAVRSAIPEGSRHVSVNLDMQYLAPAGPGTLLATGRIVRLGRRLAFARAEVTDAAGLAIATAQVTIAISPPPVGDRPGQ